MRPMQILAIERVNNKPVAYHHFPTAAKGKNAYTGVISFNALNSVMCDVCAQDYNARRFSLYTPHDMPGFELMEKSMKQLGIIGDDLPQHHHTDIWAFYKAVGYDHKSKKLAPAKN